MCKKKVIAYFVSENSTPIDQIIFKKFFPNIKVLTYIFDDYFKNNISSIMNKLENKFCVRQYMLSLTSSEIQEYFISYINKYFNSTFISLRSTAIVLRENPPKNLLFALESDNYFISKWISLGQLIEGNNILLTDCSDDIYIQGIIKLVNETGVKIICLNDMNTPENQELLLNATVIACSTLNFQNLLNMVSYIPKTYSNYITIIDFGPENNEQLTQLKNVSPPNIIRLTQTTPSTMMTLSSNNEWVNTIKIKNTDFTFLYNVCVYTILNSMPCWNKLLIKSNLVRNDNYYVYGLCYYGIYYGNQK